MDSFLRTLIDTVATVLVRNLMRLLAGVFLWAGAADIYANAEPTLADGFQIVAAGLLYVGASWLMKQADKLGLKLS